MESEIKGLSLGICRENIIDGTSGYVKEIYRSGFTIESRIPVLDDCCYDLIIFKEAKPIPHLITQKVKFTKRVFTWGKFGKVSKK